jgi:hypothetical protein
MKIYSRYKFRATNKLEICSFLEVEMRRRKKPYSLVMLASCLWEAKWYPFHEEEDGQS